MAENQKQERKSKFFRKLGLVIVLGFGGLVGWLLTRSVFLAGLALGVAIGLVVGFSLAAAGIFVYAVEDPDGFMKLLRS